MPAPLLRVLVWRGCILYTQDSLAGSRLSKGELLLLFCYWQSDILVLIFWFRYCSVYRVSVLPKPKGLVLGCSIKKLDVVV